MKRGGPLPRDPEKNREWRERSQPLKRGWATNRRSIKGRAKAISPASPAQRDKVADRKCLACPREEVHPAHIIDRSIGGDDDARSVVPLCFSCHRAYDEGQLDLLPFLEPDYREELAYAVHLIGLIPALQRITNTHWYPEGDARLMVLVTDGAPEDWIKRRAAEIASQVDATKWEQS